MNSSTQAWSHLSRCAAEAATPGATLQNMTLDMALVTALLHKARQQEGTCLKVGMRTRNTSSIAGHHWG
jgi:hypothetical protein